MTSIMAGMQALAGEFILARIDVASILVAQDFVAGVHVLEGRLQPGQRTGVFQLATEDGSLPVVVPTRHFRLMPEVPDDRRFLFVLAADGVRLGVACSALQVVHGAALDARPLPPVMRLPSTPVIGMATVGDEIAFLCDGRRLLGLFGEEAA